MLGLLTDVETRNIDCQLKNMLAVQELEEDSVNRHFRITAADGKSDDTRHCTFFAVIAVG